MNRDDDSELDINLKLRDLPMSSLVNIGLWKLMKAVSLDENFRSDFPNLSLCYHFLNQLAYVKCSC